MDNSEQQPTSPVRRALRPDTLASSIAVLLVVNVVQRSVGFGRGVLFCRWLSPESLGHWEMAYSFLLLAAPLAVLGMPGSFGRYLERFRQQGRLQLFLKRTTVWTFGLAGLFLLMMAIERELFADLIFGDHTRTNLMLLVSASLAAVILHHFLEAIFAGLRLFRVVSTMHFVQSMLFAAISLSLLVWWRTEAHSLVIGYGLACAISAAGVLWWSFRRVDPVDDHGGWLSHQEFWPPLMKFAVWVWVSNLLTNLFSIIDRYMLVHWSGFDSSHSLELVGNYHCANIVPLLLVSIAQLLVGAVTPHLSYAWEAGKRDEVSQRLNFTLKLTALGMTLAGVAVLGFCPVLFRIAFDHKYEAGLAALPWAVASCVWTGLLLVSQAYVWCAEKTRLAAVPLLVGLLFNALLNVYAVPNYGLLGAVVATALATWLALAVQLVVNWQCGMALDRGMILASAAPLLLTGGFELALVGAGLLAVLCVISDRVLTPGDRGQIFSRLPRTFTSKLSRPNMATPQ